VILQYLSVKSNANDPFLIAFYLYLILQFDKSSLTPMYSKSKLIFRFVKQIRSIILIPLSIFPLLNSYRGLSSMKKYYKIKENINGKHDKRIRSLQFPVSKSLDKHS